MQDLQGERTERDRIPIPDDPVRGGRLLAPNILSIIAGVEVSISASPSWMIIFAPVFFCMSVLPAM